MQVGVTPTSLFLVAAIASFGCANVVPVGSGGSGGNGGDGGTGGMVGPGGSGGATGGQGGSGGVTLACGSPSSAFAVCGTIRGETPPDGSLVIAWWLVEPDGYKFGDGTTSGDTYVLEFSAPPPADALFEGTLGIAAVLVLPTGFGAIPDGPVSESNELTGAWIGVGPNDAIMYRTSSSLVEWDMAFPANEFSCGACVMMEMGFDEFAPFECSEGFDLEGSSTPADLDYQCNFT